MCKGAWAIKPEEDVMGLPNKAKLIVAGHGGFFAGPESYQSNFVIESTKKGRGPKYLLFDCGTDAKFSLKELHIPPDEVDAVYVSHQHGDHCGGLEWLGFGTYFREGAVRPQLICNEGLMVDLWEHGLKGSMSSIQGKVVTLSEYFQCNAVPTGGWFHWDDIFFETVQTIHVLSGFSIQHSYGLRFWPSTLNIQRDTSILRRYGGGDVIVGGPGEKRLPFDDYFCYSPPPPIVFITGDCRFNSPGLGECYRDSGLILHDCEVGPRASGVHPHYDDLKGLPEDVRRRMLLYHCELDDAVARKDGFQGALRKGQEICLWG